MGIVIAMNMAIPSYTRFMDMYRQQRSQEMLSQISNLIGEAPRSSDSVNRMYESLRENMIAHVQEIAQSNEALRQKLEVDKTVYEIKEVARKRSSTSELQRQMLLKVLEPYIPAELSAEFTNLSEQSSTTKQFEVVVDLIYVSAIHHLAELHKGVMKDYFSLLAALQIVSIVLRSKRVGESTKMKEVIEELTEASPQYNLIISFLKELDKASAVEIEHRIKEEEVRFANKADWEVNDDLSLIQIVVRTERYLENIGYGIHALPESYTINYDLMS